MTFNDALRELSLVHIKMNGKGYSDLIKFDFKKRRISNGETVLYDNGKIIPQKINLCGYHIELTEDMEIIKERGDYETLEDLYRVYKYSVAEPYDNYAKHNFVAVDIDDLSREQFENGGKRQVARIALESYVMFSEWVWENPNHHYWQSPNIKSLILYKEWVKGENNANLS